MQVEAHEIKPVNTAKKERADRGRTKPASQDEQKEFDCNRCGCKHEYRKCPAFGQTSKSCKKNNNFAKMCKAQGYTRKCMLWNRVTVKITCSLSHCAFWP